eukprot:CAMPEP_0194517148 /NCGR_PEP_ID=MMETSP0253-20130528/50220_1 /TAXON_ID=2966 /ORGANISM="Noctiluca scintillans" /LENGTH=279 /DNA_ID=CAMNT_0039361075 /DNA_START=30 /DNA_END=870 /DNA_ORIENTATION=+
MGAKLSAAQGSTVPLSNNLITPRTPPIKIVASTLGGRVSQVSFSPSDTVELLKEQLACDFDVGGSHRRLQLSYGNQILQDHDTLDKYEIRDDIQVGVVVLPPAPEWAHEIGLTYEHPELLREYYENHALSMPEDWASDEAVWEAMRRAREETMNNKKVLKSWNHAITLSQGDVPQSLLRARPKEQLNLTIEGEIWNKNGDTCIHQLMLVLDKEIVAEVSDGVPCRGRKIHKRVTVQAPSQPGTYMFWKIGDLQYSMADARRNAMKGSAGESQQDTPTDL